MRRRKIAISPPRLTVIDTGASTPRIQARPVTILAAIGLPAHHERVSRRIGGARSSLPGRYVRETAMKTRASNPMIANPTRHHLGQLRFATLGFELADAASSVQIHSVKRSFAPCGHCRRMFDTLALAEGEELGSNILHLGDNDPRSPDCHGGRTSGRHAGLIWRMSALHPIAIKLWHCSEMMRGAMNGQMQCSKNTRLKLTRSEHRSYLRAFLLFLVRLSCGACVRSETRSAAQRHRTHSRPLHRFSERPLGGLLPLEGRPISL
jgi:hypothetical protein